MDHSDSNDVDFSRIRRLIKDESNQFILENARAYKTRSINIDKTFLIQLQNEVITTKINEHWQRYAQMFNLLTFAERRIIYYKYLSQKTDVYTELNAYYSRSQYFRVKRTAEYDLAYLLDMIVA
ncbi:MAG TPA: hypothetical protein DCW31_05045 [Lactobacillus sp.]|nr:hypothetical protein [Lactobacillus sp.]